MDQNELLGKSPFRTKVRLGMKRFIAGDYPSLSTFAQNVTHIHSKQADMDDDESNASLWCLHKM